MKSFWEKILKLISSQEFWMLLVPFVNFILIYFTSIDVSKELLAVVNSAFALVAAVIALIKRFKKAV
jgi:hypothetical protein